MGEGCPSLKIDNVSLLLVRLPRLESLANCEGSLNGYFLLVLIV
jgi:hypothetical protein